MTAGGRRVLLATLLESRPLSAGLCGAALGHLALVAMGLPGWPCPVRFACGIPCPGCGLGRAGVLLLEGQFTASLHVHAFAGFVLGAVALIGLAGVLPGERRRRLAGAVAALEQRWPVVPAGFAALLVYWLGRFALDAEGFIQLGT